jgi:hypothetical protein
MTCIDCRFFRRIEGDTFCKHYNNELEQIDKYCLDKPCPYEQPILADSIPMNYSRIEADLDSIEVSSSPRRKIKIYFNTRSDTKADVERRIIDACQYAALAEELLKNELPKREV